MNKLEIIFELFNKLTDIERNNVLSKLLENKNDDKIKPERQLKCPHCESKQFVSNGSVNGRKRYKCNNCKRSFGDYSGTVLSNIKKMNKFLKYKEIMLNEGTIPLKMMCSRVGISIKTAFDWRHKLIGSLSESNDKFENETQIDDIWVSYSQKGRRGLKFSKKRGGNKKAGDNNYQAKILTATNKDQTVMKVARIGRITKSDIQRKLGNKFKTGTKIISDSHPSIVGFAKDIKLNHVYFKSKEHIASTGENLQFLNNQASRLDTMINRTLKGVSTKYLQNYVNWFSFVETNKGKDINEIANVTILKDKNGWNRFTNTERIYKHFIENFSVRTYRCPVLREWKANNWNDQYLNKLSHY